VTIHYTYLIGGVLEMSVRGSDRKFANMPVTKETMVKLRQLAGDRHYYSVIGELVDNALANKQAKLGGGFGGGTKSEDKENFIIAKVMRLFGSERGQDVLRKAELLHYPDDRRVALFKFVLLAEENNATEETLVFVQRNLALQLEGLSELDALGVTLGKIEHPGIKKKGASGLFRKAEA
jgi:hypothetical protein